MNLFVFAVTLRLCSAVECCIYIYSVHYNDIKRKSVYCNIYVMAFSEKRVMAWAEGIAASAYRIIARDETLSGTLKIMENATFLDFLISMFVVNKSENLL